jgi:hypothetical protein
VLELAERVRNDDGTSEQNTINMGIVGKQRRRAVERA